MISIDIMGGLGNQLFQIMTIIAYSMKYNNPFVIEKKSSSPGCTFRNVYWNNFLSKLDKYLINYPINLPVYEEKSNQYNELPNISRTENIKLSGYFQSYKYFDSYKNDILKVIDYDNIKNNLINKLKTDVNPGDMISLHFRIGDIIKVHNVNNIIIPVDYYINAIKYIESKTNNSNVKFLYFCEEEDNDYVLNTYINPLKKLFPNSSYYKAGDNIEDWEQLVLMSLCEHHIIANSTFSWWGAYLSNYNINKIVCYPDKWHHSNLITYSTVDLFPDNWTMCKTQRESIPYLLENVYYINLKDYEDRRINTENELKRMNWKYERFEAFKADDGRLGCCISHLKVIEMAKEKNLDYVVVVEDDILFTEPDKYNNMLIDFKNYIKLNNMTFDVLLFAASINTGGVKPITNNIYKASACFTTTGYIVNKHYYDKLIDNFKEAVGLLINNGETDIGCIDVNWIKLQKIDNWYILFPRTVNQRPSYSTIQKNNVNYSSMLLDNL